MRNSEWRRAKSGSRMTDCALRSPHFHSKSSPFGAKIHGKLESRIWNLESPHAFDPAARARRGVPVGVRLAGRAGRRADRVARHPAGGGVPRPRPADLPGEAGGLLAAADLVLDRCLRRRLERAVLGRGGPELAGDRRDPARPVPGAPVGVLPVADRGRSGFPQLSMGYPSARIGPAGPAADALGMAARPRRGGTGAVRRLAVPVAGVPADVPLGRGEANQRRRGLVDLAGPRLPLLDPAAAHVDELVHAPDARVVPPAIDRVHVLRRAGRAVLRLRTPRPPPHRIRQPGAPPAPDHGDRQLRLLQLAGHRALFIRAR